MRGPVESSLNPFGNSYTHTHTHTHPFLEVSLSPPEMLFFAAFGMERLELRSLSAQKFVGLSDLDGSFLSLFLCELSPCPGDTLYVQTQYIQTRMDNDTAMPLFSPEI